MAPVHPLASVARTVNTEAPALVGVPLIAPLLAASASPAGRLPEVTA